MKISNLKNFNKIMGVLHLVQGIAVVLLSNDATRQVIANYLAFDEQAQKLVPATRDVFEFNLPWAVAIFFFLSAAAHFYVVARSDWYAKNLKQGINKARWYEYSLSASLMMVLIAVLAGVLDLATLVAVFGATAIMNLCGLVMEMHNKKNKVVEWVSFNVGVVAGIIPWGVVGIALWASETASNGDVPTFVYGIFVSLFLFFAFALNMYLQYKGVGKWKDYLYGETVYIVLSLTAKSALAWQIFAGALQPV